MNPYVVGTDAAKKSIRKWKDALAVEKDIQAILKQYNGYSFEIGNLPPMLIGDTKRLFHVYIGLDEQNKPEFFMVDTLMDTPDNINNEGAIVRFPANIVTPQDDSEIPKNEADKRMLAWKNDHEKWLSHIYSTNGEVFRGWDVPIGDLANNFQYHKYAFGLTTIEGKLDIELIGHCRKGTDGRTEAFYDLVRPVPPFKGGKAAYQLIVLADQ